MNNRYEQPSEPTLPSAESGRWWWLHRLIEPPVLFTVLTALLLGVLWGTTVNMIARERAAAERAAETLAADIADTYEAHAVRALREIDETLKLIRYALSETDTRRVLPQLRTQGLLPPEILFSVSITDATGVISEGNHPEHGTTNVANSDYFQTAREIDGMAVGTPEYDKSADEWRLHFARRLQNDNGDFAGIVMMSVHAGFFVSGYETDDMGRHGVLGLVGTDGVFRARRTGDTVSAGKEINYDQLVKADNNDHTAVTLEINSWDSVERYTVARKLFNFPLAIVVGLSRTEQFAPANRTARTYTTRAIIASILLLLVLGLLGRLSWQLQKARERVAEERVAHAKRVEHLAYHDSLTDLPNRAFFSRLLSQGIQQARRYERKLSLLFLDLDRFKFINDSLGHETGDELLQEVGRRLRDAVRESDIVARLGGDEFVVLLPEIHSPTEAIPVAEKVLSAISKPFNLAGQEFRVTVSVGISLFPDDGVDEQTLIKNADLAMYHAKEQGKNNYQFYSEELNSDSLERLALESNLRNALERNEFRLFYQAKRDMISGSITGMEALLRWQHPDLGLVAPMQFIPLAEETGLIIPIGLWVLKTACRQSVDWRDEGFTSLSMAVNLSPRQFLDDNLLTDIKDILVETGMDPQLLELEITESMLMHDMSRAVHIMKNLKDMGIRIAIDDFGTGYSSLSTLKEFPLDTIKIDGTFIHDVATNTGDKSLAEAVIAVGKSLGLMVVAEGVETSEQADFLRSKACNEFQGFYINRPMPAEEFIEVVRTQQLQPSTPDRLV